MRFVSTGISISSINRIKELAEEKKYAEALEILDTQNLDKSINPQFLRISGEIFRESKRYYDSRKILLKSHQMSPQGIRIIYELIQLYLELGYFTKARKYYEQYLFYSTSEDIQKVYVEYIMKKATGAGIKELASILIPILEQMPEDKWNFEAVLLYDKMGRKDKALEECQYILENFKNSVFVHLVIEYIDDKLDVDKYFYVYPKEEIPEDEELFGDLIAQEGRILEEDYLRMYPPEARILVETEDKEIIEVKSAKEKKPKKAKKRKTKEQNVNNDVDANLEEEKNSDIELYDLSKEKAVDSELRNQLDENLPPDITGDNSGGHILDAEIEKIVEDERIRREREEALDKLLSKKISTEQIKKSAQQVAKVVKEIDTEKTKYQVKAVAESVKDNVKKATDVLGEVVGVKALSDDMIDGVMPSDSELIEDDAIVDGIIESVLEPPKKVVGQVVMNEELDALIPESLEAMSAEEIADIEAKQREAERLELEALEASFKLEEEKKWTKKKSLNDMIEKEDSQKLTRMEGLSEVTPMDNVLEMTQAVNADITQEMQMNHLNAVSEDDYSQLKAQLLKEIEGEQEEPLESLGFITVVQSDVDKSIEEDIPDAANMLHQMIQNKEFYTGDDSTQFESKASYDNRNFEVEDYDFETYRDVEKSVRYDIIEEYETNLGDSLSVEMIFAQEDVLDFDEIIPIEKETVTLKETIIPEETVTPKETIIPEETVTPKETIIPEETVTPKETIIPEETVTPKETIIPEETVTLKETIIPEEMETLKETLVPEETVTPKETIIPEEIRKPKEPTTIKNINSLEQIGSKMNSGGADIEKKVAVNTRERLRVRILISDSMIKKLSELKESR